MAPDITEIKYRVIQKTFFRFAVPVRAFRRTDRSSHKLLSDSSNLRVMIHCNFQTNFQTELGINSRVARISVSVLLRLESATAL